MQPRSQNSAQGIDVSHYQGVIDWNKVKASGITFAFMKASEGKSYRDKRFLENVKGAAASGLLTGPYHFLNARTPEEAGVEARNFAAAIQAAGGPGCFALPPVLDYENNPGGLDDEQITGIALAFLREIEQLTGRRPMLYTGNSFAAKFGPALSGYKLWIARYSSSKVPSDVPAWTRWHFWQTSSKGSVPGIQGNVDLNVYAGTVQELKNEFILPKGDNSMPNPNNKDKESPNPSSPSSPEPVPQWKEEGRKWLIANAGIHENWKPGDHVDIGTLGTILARLYNSPK
ncbi:glycoside hydrolase family 25 protein [Paenibacillus tuaregi]|uniref:glycoside hydrolase family 25 protein n=1 Tax=Paenibacillus tuaregi TaxID=1816681 RepID=UPI0008399D85|nr:glycoside hydrolase family 25 protein [Paenibacillus tuaregi]